MAHICNKYKLGDIVIYNGDYYRVTSVRRTTTSIPYTSIPYTILDYEYNLFLDRDPREGELSLIKGVNERAISRKVDEIYEDLKTPKYNVNDIVIIDKDFSYEYGYSVVVGIIKDVFNHRDTGEVFYHIIFNSGTPKKLFEYEIKAKFDTGKFKDGQSIHKQLLAKMYHTNCYDYLSEKEVIAWVYANFEVRKEMYYPNHRWDPKFMEKMYPVKSSLEALEELNKRQMESIMAETIRIDIDDAIKANYSKEEIKKMINKAFGTPVISLPLTYKKIIFNGPCTIILWTDGSKTIAKTSSDEEVFDPEKGVAICFMKKMLGHTETNKILRKASEQYEEYIAENRPNGSFDEFIDFCKNYFKSETKPEEVKKVEEDQDDN